MDKLRTSHGIHQAWISVQLVIVIVLFLVGSSASPVLQTQAGDAEVNAQASSPVRLVRVRRDLPDDTLPRSQQPVLQLPNEFAETYMQGKECLERERRQLGTPAERATDDGREARASTVAMHIVSSVNKVTSSLIQLGDHMAVKNYDPTLDSPLRGLWEVHDALSSSRRKISRYFDTRNLDDGYVKILKSGVYLINYQVAFLSPSLHHSIQLRMNSQTISTCIVSERYVMSNSGDETALKSHLPCTGTIVVHLPKDAELSLHSPYRNRWLLPTEELTYWGITKL